MFTYNVNAKEINIYFYPNGGTTTSSGFSVTEGYKYLNLNNTDYYAVYKGTATIKNINSINKQVFTLTKDGTNLVEGREWYLSNINDGKIYYFSNSKKYKVETIMNTLGYEDDSFASIDLYANWEKGKKTGGKDMPSTGKTSTTSNNTTKKDTKKSSTTSTHKVIIRYNTNKGKLTDPHGANYTTKKDYIYKDNNINVMIISILKKI